MSEYPDYFDPFAVEIELPLGYECDLFAGGRDPGLGFPTGPRSDTVEEVPSTQADTHLDADQGEGN